MGIQKGNKKKNDLLGTKVVKLLGDLEIGELNLMGKWLKSPWCNSNKKLIPLFQVLKRNHPNFDAPYLNKANIYQKLNPGKKFNRSILNNLFTAMCGAIEKFLVYQNFKNDTSTQKFLLIKSQLDKSGISEAMANLKSLISDTEGKSVIESSDHLRMSALHQEICFSPKLNFQTKTESEHLNKAKYHLDFYYVLECYRLLHEAVERDLIVNKEKTKTHELKFLQCFMKNFNNPAINQYDIRLTRINSWDYGDFSAEIDLFLTHIDEMPRREQKIFFRGYINDGIQLVAKGCMEAYEMIFTLYQTMIKKELLLLEGTLSHFAFNNIITAANSLGKLEFAKSFLNDYKKYLPHSIREDAICWANAEILFFSKAYDEVADLILGSVVTSRVILIQLKNTAIKANYEIALMDNSQWQYVINQSKTFEKFISRNEMYSERIKKGYGNFIRLLRRMAQLHKNAEFTIDKTHKIKAELNIDQTIFNRIWLGQKLAEWHAKGH